MRFTPVYEACFSLLSRTGATPAGQRAPGPLGAGVGQEEEPAPPTGRGWCLPSSAPACLQPRFPFSACWGRPCLGVCWNSAVACSQELQRSHSRSEAATPQQPCIQGPTRVCLEGQLRALLAPSRQRPACELCTPWGRSLRRVHFGDGGVLWVTRASAGQFRHLGTAGQAGAVGRTALGVFSSGLESRMGCGERAGCKCSRWCNFSLK